MNADDFLPNAETVAAIEKDIATYNARRRVEHAALERREPVMTMAYFAGLAALTWLAWLALRNSGNPFIVGMVPAFGLGFWPRARKWIKRDAVWTQQNFRDHVVPVMLGFVPELRYAHGITPRSFERIPKELLPRHNRRTFDDVVSASLEGRRFELFEAKLVQSSKNSETVMFEGAILHCRRRNAFAGLLVVTRRAGDWQRFFRDLFGTGGLSEITVREGDLSSLYEFRSDNRAAARQLLAGGLADMLRSVSRLWSGQTPQIAISGEDVFVLLPSTRSFFDLPEIDREVSYGAHIEPMARQFASFLAVVSEVSRLDGAGEAPEPAVAPASPAAVAEGDEEPFVPLLDGGAPPRPQ